MVDVGIRHVQVTQVLQIYDNSLPLVAGKPTVARVIPTVLGNQVVHGVDAELVELVNDLPAGTTIRSSNGPISVDKTNSRRSKDQTLDFMLEPAWWSGQRKFRVTLLFPEGANEINPANNSCDFEATFHHRDPINLRYVLVKHQSQEPSARVQQMRTINFLRAVLPIDPLDLSYEPAIKPTREFNEVINGQLDDASLIVELNKIFLTDSHAQKLYGWTGPSVFQYNGRSDPIYAGGQGYVAFGNDDGDDDDPATWRWRRTLAHEFGHNLYTDGLHHPSKYPESIYYYPHRLQADQYGYDVLGIDPLRRVVMRESALEPETALYDCMVPAKMECEAWIGRRNYCDLFEVTQTNATKNWHLGGGQPDAERYFVVHGAIRRTVHVSIPRAGDAKLERPGAFNPLLVNTKVRTIADLTPRGSGEATIRFFDQQGDQIDEPIGWKPRFQDAEGNPADSWFSWVTRIPPETERITLEYNGVERDQVFMLDNGHGEDLAVTNEEATIDPDTQTLDITWTTEGYQPGRTNFTVSCNHGNAEVWSEISDGEQEQNPALVRIPLANLPGPIDSELSVLVERGGKVAVSEEPFSVQGPQDISVPSKVEIVAPENIPVGNNGHGPRTFRSGEHILLIGYFARYKTRDPAANLSWDLVQGGKVTHMGQGEKLVYREGIAAGEYLVRLTCTDTGDEAGVNIRVID